MPRAGSTAVDRGFQLGYSGAGTPVRAAQRGMLPRSRTRCAPECWVKSSDGIADPLNEISVRVVPSVIVVKSVVKFDPDGSSVQGNHGVGDRWVNRDSRVFITRPQRVICEGFEKKLAPWHIAVSVAGASSFRAQIRQYSSLNELMLADVVVMGQHGERMATRVRAVGTAEVFLSRQPTAPRFPSVSGPGLSSIAPVLQHMEILFALIRRLTCDKHKLPCQVIERRPDVPQKIPVDQA
jgi:hypothetical protein